jgi:putative cell wall-binding protein
MTVSPRIRRSAAAIAAFGTAGTGIGLFTSSAEALPPPVPVTQYGPDAKISALWAATPTMDWATADASTSAAGTNVLDPNGYSYFCGRGGTVTVPSTTATTARCETPVAPGSPSPYPMRMMGVTAHDTAGLAGIQEVNAIDGTTGPDIHFTVTAGTGAPGEQRVMIDTAGTTGASPTFGIACGTGTGILGVHDTGTLWHCDFPSGGLSTITVAATDGTTLLGSSRQASVYVNAKPTAVLTTTRTGPLSISAEINGSSVDPHLTGTYSIAWGDGTSSIVDPAVSTQAVHTYPTNPAGPPVLTVTDSAAPTPGVATATGNGLHPGVYRYWGQTRYETAVSVSTHSWDALSNVTPGARHPQAVVLARGDGYADALAGVPLAAKKKGPLLLTPTASLDPKIQAEIQRILPTTGANKTVYILGGTSAVSQNVENQLIALGYTVVRFGGNDRFATALKIAADPNAMNSPARVVVATGYNFPDALSAGPYASLPSVNGAIVLSQDNTFDSATATYVAAKFGAGGNVTAVGGQAKTAVAALPGSLGHYTSFAGDDRYDTAARVAGLGGTSPFASNAPVGVSTGTNYPDSLTGGAMMAQLGGPMLLTAPTALSGPTAGVLTTLKPTLSEVDMFGGAAALSDATGDGIVTVVAGVRHF